MLFAAVTESPEMVGPLLPDLPATWKLIAHFLLALAATAAGTWWVLRRSGGVGLDEPDNRRKFHEKAVPRLGGAPIFATLVGGMLIAAWLGYLSWSFWMPLLVCNTLMFSVGFVDDLNPLGARIKLIGQIGAALILWSLGVSIDLLSNPFGQGGISLGWWSLPLTILWLVAIPNIINLIDGMDGLATGFGMFLALTLAFVGYFSFKVDVLVVSVIMAGALGGFLIFNLPPAKIFLGDGGAYLIGFFIASVSLQSSNKGSVIAALFVIVIALGVPILDTSFAIMRRAIRGVPIFSADAEHIHHRLMLLGYSKGRALVAMYSVCMVLSLVGISILMTKGVALPVAGAVLFLLAVGAARYLGYVRSWSRLRDQITKALEQRRKLAYVQTHARLLEFELEVCDEWDEFSRLFHHALNRIGITLENGPDVKPIEMVLENGGKITLYRPKNVDSTMEWNSRADVLMSPIEGCLEKWGNAPLGIQIRKDTLSQQLTDQSGAAPSKGTVH